MIQPEVSLSFTGLSPVHAVDFGLEGHYERPLIRRSMFRMGGNGFLSFWARPCSLELPVQYSGHIFHLTEKQKGKAEKLQQWIAVQLLELRIRNHKVISVTVYSRTDLLRPGRYRFNAEKISWPGGVSRHVVRCSYRERGREAELEAPELERSLDEVVVASLQAERLVHQPVPHERVSQQVPEWYVHRLLQENQTRSVRPWGHWFASNPTQPNSVSWSLTLFRSLARQTRPRLHRNEPQRCAVQSRQLKYFGLWWSNSMWYKPKYGRKLSDSWPIVPSRLKPEEEYPARRKLLEEGV